MSPLYADTWYWDVSNEELRQEIQNIYQKLTELNTTLTNLNLSVGEDGELYYNGVQIS